MSLYSLKVILKKQTKQNIKKNSKNKKKCFFLNPIIYPDPRVYIYIYIYICVCVCVCVCVCARARDYLCMHTDK